MWFMCHICQWKTCFCQTLSKIGARPSPFLAIPKYIERLTTNLKKMYEFETRSIYLFVACAPDKDNNKENKMHMTNELRNLQEGLKRGVHKMALHNGGLTNEGGRYFNAFSLHVDVWIYAGFANAVYPQSATFAVSQFFVGYAIVFGDGNSYTL